jgi:serine protease Do
LRKSTFIKAVVAGLLIGAVWNAQAEAKERGVVKLFTELQREIIDISDGVKKSVVHIEVVQKSETSRRFQSLGSGIIVDSTGHILTNEHVVGRSVSIKVTLQDKREYSAEVVGVDKQTDLALLKIDAASRLSPAKFGNSDKVEVGEWVIAVGNPFGFDRTVSFGIVSGKGRVIRDMPTETPLLNNFIQTDAAIDPGSSGGPLVNLQGEVVGINSIGIGRGQGFTIPSNMARNVIERLKSQGSVDRGWLGVSVQPFDRRFAKYYGADTLQGILIGDVEAESPAEAAGLLPGDVLMQFDREGLSAENVDDLNDFTLMVTARSAGDSIPLKVYRDGKVLTHTVSIGQQPKVKADEFETPFGFTAKEITFNLARALRLPDRQGVLVDYVEVGSVAGEAELEEGDVIRAIEGHQIADLAEFKTVADAMKVNKMLLLHVQRGQVERLVLFDLTATPDSAAAMTLPEDSQ